MVSGLGRVMDFTAPVKRLGDMLYPEICRACRKWLVNGEEQLCLHCVDALPRTYYGFQKHNPVEKIFWGRIPFEFAGSFLFYHDKGMVRNLLHRIKYQGGRDLAESLGRMFAEDLLRSDAGFRPDLLIPVPLHPRKLRQRGYNQSLCIAQGMASVLQTTVRTDLVLRNRYSLTQTRRNRFDRWLNVEDIFTVAKPEEMMRKTVVFIDDVITTGATIEACVRSIMGCEGVKTGILSLALARN